MLEGAKDMEVGLLFGCAFFFLFGLVAPRSMTPRSVTSWSLRSLLEILGLMGLVSLMGLVLLMGMMGLMSLTGLVVLMGLVPLIGLVILVSLMGVGRCPATAHRTS